MDGEVAWREACRETGRVIASLTSVPLDAADRVTFESRFYDGLGTLEAYLERILELGRSIHARDPDSRDGFWRESLDFVDARLDGILSQSRLLYHQDAGKLHVQQGRFMGFFDLEMCRVGCAAIQLASSPGVFDGDKAQWEPFRQGWEAATNRPLDPDDLRVAAAAHQLLCWREISRYLSYDGTPRTGFLWACPADPLRYRNAIESVKGIMGVRW